VWSAGSGPLESERREAIGGFAAGIVEVEIETRVVAESLEATGRPGTGRSAAW